MKLTRIHIENFLGAHLVDIELNSPVTLIAGSNGAGKSSVRDAVALALTADLGRVALKKDAGRLVTEGGAGTAHIDLQVDGRTLSMSITAGGRIIDKSGGFESPALRFVLEGQRFAKLKTEERRAFLFDLMGLQADGKAVAERLAVRGCDMTKAERVAPLLRAGFDRAHTEAKAQATQARGAWKAITGETYGSEKAKTWRALKPGAAAEGEPTDAAKLKACDEALAVWQRQIGALQAEQARRYALSQKLPALRDQADRMTRLQARLTTDEAELSRLAGELERLRAAAGVAPRVGLVHDLAALLGELIDIEGPQPGTQAWADKVVAALEAYEAEHGPLATTAGDPEASARIPAVEQSHALLVRAVANDRRDIEAATRAQSEHDTITTELKTAFDAAQLTEAQRQVEALTTERKQLAASLDAAAAAKRAADQAKQKTADAARHHADVEAWESIADALSPNGIPAELLSEALTPMNDALAGHAESARWPRVAIEAEMEITADGRAYGLLSESEQWRCDAMLAAAIAQLSDVRLLVLDRFDVLDVASRGDLVVWLDDLAVAGDIDTALIFGTLKTLPSNLPSTIDAHWMHAGRVVQLEAA